MIKYLEDNILPYKTKEEIEALLGESLQPNALPNRPRVLIYCIGHDYGLQMKVLLIVFHEDGSFQSMRIIKAD